MQLTTFLQIKEIQKLAKNSVRGNRAKTNKIMIWANNIQKETKILPMMCPITKLVA